MSVVPYRAAISRWKCRSASALCATVYCGSARSTQGKASWSRPLGEPSGSRSMIAPLQAGSSRPTPARRSSSLFTHCACTLSSCRQTGRSGTTRSMAAAVISSTATLSGYQPPPRMAGSSGCSAANNASRSRHSRTERQSASLTSKSSPVANDGCRWASTKPGRTRRPPRSTVRVRGPAHSAASAALPSATTRPSLTAIASWRERRASTVYTTPFTRTRSACMLGSSSASPAPVCHAAVVQNDLCVPRPARLTAGSRGGPAPAAVRRAGHGPHPADVRSWAIRHPEPLTKPRTRVWAVWTRSQTGRYTWSTQVGR